MSWRTVVISRNAKLDYQIGYLVIRSSDTIKIHINEISILMIESTAVSMTAYLMNELIKHKVKIIFCDEKRNPSAELLPYYGSHDTSIKIKKQMDWDEDNKQSVWTEIVTEKIYRQACLLQKLGKKQTETLQIYMKEIEFGDITNREGHAAKIYFRALFGNDFTRTDENPINAALNYGYSILLSAFNREIVSNGYLTQIGLCHDNMFNPFNLASDFMEPYRSLVDEKVWFMNPEIFETEEKHEILSILNEEVVIGERREYVSNAIKIYAKSIFDALNDRDISLIKFYKNEL